MLTSRLRRFRLSCPDTRPGGLGTAAGVLLVALALSVSSMPATAQDLVDPGLTIYMQNTALVRVTVDRSFPAGEQSLRVDGLPGNLDTASLVVLDPGATLLGVHGRRNYQSAEDGNSVSIVLDLDVDRPMDGLRLAYLTRGMSWSPSYTMIVAPDDASARIDGYATVMNSSGTAYPEAEVQLLAGSVNVGGGAMPSAGVMQEAWMAEDMARAGRAPQLSGQAFSGYHLYDVDVPLTLHTGDSRRIRLLGAESVPVTREYVLMGAVEYRQRRQDPQPQEAFIRYLVERGEGSSFADLPLPGGTVRMYQPDEQGRLQLLGGDAIANTPAGEEIRLTVGQAFDIQGVRTQTDWSRTANDIYESSWSIELVNRSDEPVVVQVIESLQGDWEILGSSHDPEQLSSSRVRFDVSVPADGEATLTYEVRVEL